jgi:hypothetical protein
MEASTTIRDMLSGNQVFVPGYQRAYSWDSKYDDSTTKTQTDVFLSDIRQHLDNDVQSQYYFGHFLFEQIPSGDPKRPSTHYNIVDGQQRLTTIVIALSALNRRLKSLYSISERPQPDDQIEAMEEVVKRNNVYRLSTVSYDDQVFRNYVVNQNTRDKSLLTTESQKRIASAFDYFVKEFATRDEAYLARILTAICNASCTTHIVQNESDAIQMFLFQNNRGKKPSHLELIKAQFMYNIHLYASGEDKDSILQEVKRDFETIYTSISQIEKYIDEDDVLRYTARIKFDSLHESGTSDEILPKANNVDFVKEFSTKLAENFRVLMAFCADENQNDVHSLLSLGVTIGGIAFAYPFVIKAYRFGVSDEEKSKLFVALESMLVRNSLVGTRADINSRFNSVFKSFTETNSSVTPIVAMVEKLKSAEDWWWAHWNNKELLRAVGGGLDRRIAKFILWKYENKLRAKKGQLGYEKVDYLHYRDIDRTELEHIAPQTEPTLTPEVKHHGYDTYDEEFVNKYMNCLGNYMLISKSHNGSASNSFFEVKLLTYNCLRQQIEIVEQVGERKIWDRKEIQRRNERLVEFVTSTF